MVYTTQGGTFPQYYNDIIKNHTLIAGATGSGKSILINNIIKYITSTAPPSAAALVLIDIKRVELERWRDCAHCLRYADTIQKITATLEQVARLMYKRFDYMKKNKLLLYNGGSIYIIVDEMAILSLSSKKASATLAELATLGRAAKIVLITATQRPTRDIITPLVSVNYINKIALRVNSKRDSINILGIASAEQLPRYGYGLILTPDYTTPQKIEIKPL